MRRAWAKLLIAALGLSSCLPSGARPAVEGSEGMPEVSGAATAPSLRVQVPWSNGGAVGGWGALRFWGAPREDELRVHAILDAPASARRWGSTCEVRLRAAERELVLRAHYVGRPMSHGVYDAVRVDLPIEDVRRLAAAPSVRGEVCGDPIELGAEQQRAVRLFLDRFDDLAVPTGPRPGDPVEQGPDLILPGEDDDNWPTPA